MQTFILKDRKMGTFDSLEILAMAKELLRCTPSQGAGWAYVQTALGLAVTLQQSARTSAMKVEQLLRQCLPCRLRTAPSLLVNSLPPTVLPLAVRQLAVSALFKDRPPPHLVRHLKAYMPL